MIGYLADRLFFRQIDKERGIKDEYTDQRI